jgi:GntR family transcriptional regulator
VAAHAGQPLWVMVAAQLREDIASGKYAPGDTIPSQEALALEWDVNADTTIRRALAALTAEGLLTPGRGRLGRQVRAQKLITIPAWKSESRKRVRERKPLGVDAWVADMAEQGYEAAQDIAVAIEKPTPRMTERLKLGEGERVVVRRRLRTVYGAPHDLNDTYYPGSIAEGTPIAQPGDVPQGVIALMAEMGYAQPKHTDEVTARMPTPEERQRLLIPDGVPLMIQTRTGYTDKKMQHPVKVTVTRWPADRALLRWELEG